ncbi:cytochrome P450 CYP82D47-like [Euphorbia lathyris]|uniref:cytochrome P450 CYP82D47-like n=1 Tax=Euphorbia lathyris TaxID=212925 RepID=UPI0033131BD7
MFDTLIFIFIFIFIFPILIIVLSSILIKKKFSKTKTAKPKQAPQVPGAWPLLGHLPKLSPPNLPHIVLGNLADKHGPIFTLRIGKHSVLIINNSDLTKEVFTTNDMNVTFRPSLVAAKIIGYNYALFPFTPGGPYWREMRKISTFELLSNRRLEQLKHFRIEEVESSIKELYRMSSGIRTVEMKRWLSDLNMNVLLRMVIGRKFGGIEEKRRFQEGITAIFKYLGTVVLRDAVWCLGWIDLGGHEKRMMETAGVIDGFLGKWLDEHKMKRLLEDDDDGKDFMDAVILFLDGKDIGGYDADTVTKATCLVSLIAGYETVTVALTWTLSLLLNNKNIFKKTQQELDQNVGKHRMVNEKDITKLTYLQAIVKESLRLYPPAFIPGPRKFTKDCTIGGYHIPKDTWLMMNLWKIHRDPNVWSDPNEFKPERFMTSHKEVDVRGQHFELLPFGGGRRECPAKSYGIQMLYFSLASLLHAFDISTVNDVPVDMSASVGLTNMKLADLEVVVSPRLPSYCFD